jgi:hypothetical protein
MFEKNDFMSWMAQKQQLYFAVQFLALPEVMETLSGFDGKTGTYSHEDLKTLINPDNMVEAEGMMAVPTKAKDLLLDKTTTAGIQLLVQRDEDTGVTVVDVLSNASDEGGLKDSEQLREMSAYDLDNAKLKIPMWMPVPYTIDNLVGDVAADAKAHAKKMGIIKPDDGKQPKKDINANSYAFFDLNNAFSPYARLKQKLAFGKPDLSNQTKGLPPELAGEMGSMFSEAYAEGQQIADNWLKQHEKLLNKLPATVSEGQQSEPNVDKEEKDKAAKAKSVDDQKAHPKTGAHTAEAKPTETKPANQSIPRLGVDKLSDEKDLADKPLGDLSGLQQKPEAHTDNVLNVKDTLRDSIRAIEMAKIIARQIETDDDDSLDKAPSKAKQGKQKPQHKKQTPQDKKAALKDRSRDIALSRCIALIDQARTSLGGLKNAGKGVSELIGSFNQQIADLEKQLKPQQQALAKKNPVALQSQSRLKKSAETKDQLTRKLDTKAKNVTRQVMKHPSFYSNPLLNNSLQAYEAVTLQHFYLKDLSAKAPMRMAALQQKLASKSTVDDSFNIPENGNVA